MNDYVIGLAAPAWVKTRGVSRAAHGRSQPSSAWAGAADEETHPRR